MLTVCITRAGRRFGFRTYTLTITSRTAGELKLFGLSKRALLKVVNNISVQCLTSETPVKWEGELF